nr:hypothetical protein [Tanacetum cinerariifolium]
HDRREKRARRVVGAVGHLRGRDAGLIPTGRGEPPDAQPRSPAGHHHRRARHSLDDFLAQPARWPGHVPQPAAQEYDNRGGYAHHFSAGPAAVALAQAPKRHPGQRSGRPQANRLNNGLIDYPALTRLTEMYLEAGAAGLFANCLSSEMFELSTEERLQSIRHVVNVAGGAVPVVATGTFAGPLNEQADFVKKVYEAGTEAVIVITGLLAE